MAVNVAGTFRERRKWPDLHYIDQVETHIIETHSPQASSSFNMLGEFDFSDGKLQDTIDVLPPKKQPEIIPVKKLQLSFRKLRSGLRRGKVLARTALRLARITGEGYIVD